MTTHEIYFLLPIVKQKIISTINLIMPYHFSNGILLLCLFLFGLATPYRRFVLFLFLSLVCLNIYKYVYLCKYQCYREFYKPISSIIGRIKPGDIISTTIPDQITLFETPSIARVVLSDFYAHTTIAIEYQGEVWMLHAYPDSIYKSITLPINKYLFKVSRWNVYMEPLLQFLNREKSNGSILRIVHTNKNISFHNQVIDTLKEQFDSRTFHYTIHCCEFIGKFLAINGIARNHSALHDSIYYTPGVLSEQGETIEYISLTEC